MCRLVVFPWAHFRRTKAAVKMHTLLDLRGNISSFTGLRSSTVTIPTRKSGSQETRRWREKDSNLYGAFPVKRLFWVVLTVFCSERERPFFVPSPATRFAERAEGVKGPKC
jgi:hypothetical protein